MHKRAACLIMLVVAMALARPADAALVASFEDLPAAPAVDGQTGLFFANNDSSRYLGITWDTRFRVAGADYRVDTATPGPRYGVPHGGQYFVTNEGDGASNDGLLIKTSLVLTGAWFGQNEYYGFDGGSDQVTIRALQGATVLASVTFDLPELLAGEPEVLSFVDTSSFAGLSGITGYRIDRNELKAPFGGNWVADDFTFAAVNAVPEPGSVALLLVGLGLLGWRRAHTARL